jgi:hypothetical protein
MNAPLVRMHAAHRYLLALMLVACANSEALDTGQSERDATGGSGSTSTGMGQGGNPGSGSGSGGVGGNGGGGGSGGSVGGDGGVGGGGGSTETGGSGGAGGSAIDAGGGRGGSSGTFVRDASVDEASTIDAPLDRITEDGGADGGDAEAGTCGPMFCFDVFECWLLFPQCGYTACELLACKK